MADGVIETHGTVFGGWGYSFGGQGSGFDLGRRGLLAVADAVDGSLMMARDRLLA